MTKQELLRIAKPILFNTDMVRAILDDRKTVTRRIVKDCNISDGQEINENLKGQFEVYNVNPRCGIPQGIIFKPPYHPGNILYVRETWQEYASITDETSYFFRADEVDCMIGEIDWRPSIHMPKEAARIFLRVTDVRVERLQDIDDKGAFNEGAGLKNAVYQIGARVCEFVKIWNSTIKKSDRDLYGWDTNPWVWVIEFERIYPDNLMKG